MRMVATCVQRRQPCGPPAGRPLQINTTLKTMGSTECRHCHDAGAMGAAPADVVARPSPAAASKAR
jgi:hypothetical protein